MPDFPTTPVPSSISAPEVIDPMLRFDADMGYEVRRARHSAPATATPWNGLAR